MEWSTVIFLGMAMVSLVVLMGVIIFGTRKTSEMKELEKQIRQNAGELGSSNEELRKALKKSEAKNEQLVERLQNLEAIVTSEAWEAIKNGENDHDIRLHLDDEETEDLNDAEKAAKIAKRVR
ncbi:hypothetical protein [Gracilimonas sp.]|uniref:hypothetical protein n=1 Tax=Gracilimonas sp. TaxID=1974203 RepID=UPI0032EAEC31